VQNSWISIYLGGSGNSGRGSLEQQTPSPVGCSLTLGSQGQNCVVGHSEGLEEPKDWLVLGCMCCWKQPPGPTKMPRGPRICNPNVSGSQQEKTVSQADSEHPASLMGCLPLSSQPQLLHFPLHHAGMSVRGDLQDASLKVLGDINSLTTSYFLLGSWHLCLWLLM
jgi:hypothetical protein